MNPNLIWVSPSEMNAVEECALRAARGWRSEGTEAEEGTRMDAHVMRYLATGESPVGDGPAERARDVIAAGVLPAVERLISRKVDGFPRRMIARKEYGPGDVRDIAFAALDGTYGITGEPEMVALGEEPNTLEIPDLKDGNIRDKWKLFKQFASYAFLAFEAWPRTLKIIGRPIFSRFLATPLRPFVFLASEREQLRAFLIEEAAKTHAALLAPKATRSDYCHNCTGRHECEVYRADVTTAPRAVVAVTMPEKLAAITELARIEKSAKKLREEFEREVDALVKAGPHRFAGKEYGYEEKPGSKEHDAEAAARIMHERGAGPDLFGKCFKVYVKGLTEHYKPLDPEGFKLIEAAKKPGTPKRVRYEREIPNLIETSPTEALTCAPQDGPSAPDIAPTSPLDAPPVACPTPAPIPSSTPIDETLTPPEAGECPALDGTGAATKEARDALTSDNQLPAPLASDTALGATEPNDPRCPKVPHVGGGYLHADDDDGPYDVDGVKYCGRCHSACCSSLPPHDPPAPKARRARKHCRVRGRECGRPHTHVEEGFMPADYVPASELGRKGPWKKTTPTPPASDGTDERANEERAGDR